MPRFREAGVDVVALSYDEQDALADFTAAHDIEFAMISDARSEVISEFGILNTLIAEDDKPWFGIPFPGTYVTDAAGVIQAKFFEDSLVLRPGVDQLLRAAQGERVEIAARVEQPDTVTCAIEFDERPTAPGIVRELVVRFAVPGSLHLYGEPVPEGMVATTIEFEADDNLIVRDTVAPPTSPLTLGATGDTLHVYAGNVTLRVPVSHNLGGGMLAKDGAGGSVPVRGRVRWQACDAHACHLPQSQEFDFELLVTSVSRPRFDGSDPMDIAGHFQRMAER